MLIPCSMIFCMTKYEIKPTRRFQKDIKLMQKRGFVIQKASSDSQSPSRWSSVARIMPYQVIGQVTVNVMSSLIGCWCTI